MIRRAAAALAAVALAGCGGGDDEERSARGSLVWDGEPQLVRQETLPDDRILSGRVRNDGLKPVELEAADIRLLDGEGRELEGNAIFLQAYLHRLDPPTREGQLSEEERRRTGLAARIEPEQSVPLTVAWREKGGRRAARVDTGEGSLPVP